LDATLQTAASSFRIAAMTVTLPDFARVSAMSRDHYSTVIIYQQEITFDYY
jgi:hypothetical protein